MQRETLGQFRGAKSMLYGPPTIYFITHDWFWLWYEVLEATGNLIEEALAAGGSNSRKGSTLSHM